MAPLRRRRQQQQQQQQTNAAAQSNECRQHTPCPCPTEPYEADRRHSAQQDRLMAPGLNQNICTRVPPMMLAHDGDGEQPPARPTVRHNHLELDEIPRLTCLARGGGKAQRSDSCSRQDAIEMTKVRADKWCLQHQIASSTRRARTRTRAKTRARVGMANALLFACLTIVIVPPLAQVRYCTGQAAVIRPTIFSDLPPEPSASGQQQVPAILPPAPASAQQSQQQQQNNQPQQAPQAIVSSQPAPSASVAHHYLNNHAHMGQNHWHHGNANQADGPQTQLQQPPTPAPQQKINPLKSRFCTAPTGLRLDHSLGLQSFAIDDLSLSASSFSNEQVRPHLARLNLDILGGAWCPMKPISSSNFGKEWIQVKLNRSFVVSAIETQGRFALGSGKEFVPSYQIEYSRNNGLTWHKWKDFRGSSLLRANDDVQTAVRNELSPPIVGANVIRLLPYSQHLRTVCLRFELHGCHYDEGAPISYTTNDGVVEPRWGHLIDYTYDGLRHRSGQLSGGLGQLVDGVKGPDNFQFNNGFEWVGWKSMNGDVIIEFTFKTLRNFTGALFYSNNLFSSGVEVFQAVDVHYGIDVAQSMESLRDALHERRRRAGASGSDMADSSALSRAARQLGAADEETGAPHQAPPGQTVWSSDVLSIEYEPDKKAESSRPVTVHLKQRLANRLRFVLKFASKWILISEVEFLSHPVELMSLASLNEQLTPKLMLALQQAKTYDEYVAILREHQLRRIAADEYLQMGAAGSSTSSSSSLQSLDESTVSSSGELDASSTLASQPADSGQQAEQATQQDDSSGSLQTQLLAKRLIGGQSQWQPGVASGADHQLILGQTQFVGSLPGAPATNPLLNSEPPTDPTGFIFDPTKMAPPNPSFKVNLNSNGGQANEILREQQQARRSLSLASAISFVFVGLVGLLAVLFAISSYRLRRAHRTKLSSASRHLGAGAVNDKNFLSALFEGATGATNGQAAGAGAASSPSSSANSTGNTLNYHAHHRIQQQHQQQAQPAHYNPLFANSSGRSSEGSLRKSGGPLSTLKRLAALTSGRTMGGSSSKRGPTGATNLMFTGPTGSNQNQLLVSLKDSLKPQISTQLIVGLNQANPLAHQQIYSNASQQQQQQQQQPLYGVGQQTNYSANTNSISLASSSSATGGTSADYATPDMQPIIRTGQTPLMLNSADHLRHSSRMTLTPGGAGRMLLAEHNYEQISSGDQMAPLQRGFNGTSGTLALHQRTFSQQQQQQQQQQQLGCQPFSSMTSGRPHLAPRQQQQQQQLRDIDANGSHYYYADTEAAKGCLR